MKILILIISLTSILIACKKDPLEFTIKGVITDQSLGGALADAQVDLYVTKAGGNQSFVESVTTNSAGEYIFVIPRDKDEQFDLIIEKDNYFTLEETILFTSLDADKDNIRNYGTTAESFVQFNLTNSAPAESGDVLKIQKLNGRQGCIGCCPIGIETFTGEINESFTCKLDAYTNFRFIYWLPDGQEAFFDSIETQPFQTSVYNINY